MRVFLAVVLHGIAAKLELPAEKFGEKTDSLGIIPNTSHSLKKLTAPVVDLIPKREDANTRINNLRESPNSLLDIKTIPSQKAKEIKIVLRTAAIDVRENISSVKRNTGITRIGEILQRGGIFFSDINQLFFY